MHKLAEAAGMVEFRIYWLQNKSEFTHNHLSGNLQVVHTDLVKIMHRFETMNKCIFQKTDYYNPESKQ